MDEIQNETHRGLKYVIANSSGLEEDLLKINPQRKIEEMEARGHIYRGISKKEMKEFWLVTKEGKKHYDLFTKFFVSLLRRRKPRSQIILTAYPHHAAYNADWFERSTAVAFVRRD